MDSMEEIYLKHGKMIYGFLLTRTQDPDLAEELTQGTFYQAVRSVDRFNGSCKVSVGQLRILANMKGKAASPPGCAA